MIDLFDMSDLDAQAAAARPVEADPWLARRLHGFGASEIGALLYALGRCTPEEAAELPKYAIANARTLFAQKAGLRRAGRAGSAASRGQVAERPLLAAWASSACPVRAQLVSVTHADAAPRAWMPLVDRHCPSATATPDGWGVDVLGDDVGLEVKTTMGARVVVPWYWHAQVQQQMACCGYAWSAIVIGEGWAHYDETNRREPRAVRVERDEAWVERVRAACRDGWARVEELMVSRKDGA